MLSEPSVLEVLEELITLQIITTDNIHKQLKAYRVPPLKKEVMEREINRMM